MHTTAPGQTTIITESGIPTGQTVGFQVIKAANGTVAIGRTTVGVVERPAGSGNYVITFIAPAEGDLYLVVVDWSAGVLAPETSKVIDLQVTTVVEPGSSGLGAIADYTKMYLGGETWKGLTESSEYGPTFVQRAIEAVKNRTMTSPPVTVDEENLDARVLAYLGLLGALQLIPAARDYWGSSATSVTRGDDASEIVTYANRTTLMNELRDDLMRFLPDVQAAALPMLDGPLSLPASGPAIDEATDTRTTDNPRTFPSALDFPGEPLPSTTVW